MNININININSNINININININNIHPLIRARRPLALGARDRKARVPRVTTSPGL